MDRRTAVEIEAFEMENAIWQVDEKIENAVREFHELVHENARLRREIKRLAPHVRLEHRIYSLDGIH